MENNFTLTNVNVNVDENIALDEIQNDGILNEVIYSQMQLFKSGMYFDDKAIAVNATDP